MRHELSVGIASYFSLMTEMVRSYIPSTYKEAMKYKAEIKLVCMVLGAFAVAVITIKQVFFQSIYNKVEPVASTCMWMSQPL